MKRQSVRKRWTRHLFVPVVLAALALAITFPVRADDQSQGPWILTVVKAQGLNNKDWGKHKLSDPFVVVKMAAGGSSRELGNTRVVKDNLNPVWNRSFAFELPPGQQPVFTFFVWDKDPMGRIFLGKAGLSYAGSGTFRLQLQRMLGLRAAPGVLTVALREPARKKKVQVPPLKGLTRVESVGLLGRKGLKSRRQVVFTRTWMPDNGKVHAQQPAPGAWVDAGSSVTFYEHQAQTRIMPDVRGMPLDKAMQTLAFLDPRPKVRRIPGSGKNPETWFKVTGQSVAPGTRVALDGRPIPSAASPGPASQENTAPVAEFFKGTIYNNNFKLDYKSTFTFLSLEAGFGLENIDQKPINMVFVVINGQQGPNFKTGSQYDVIFGRGLAGIHKLANANGKWTGAYKVYTSKAHKSVAATLFDLYGNKALIIDILNAKYNWNKTRAEKEKTLNYVYGILKSIRDRQAAAGFKKPAFFICGFSRGAVLTVNLSKKLVQNGFDVRAAATIDPVINPLPEKNMVLKYAVHHKRKGWITVQKRGAYLAKNTFPILKNPGVKNFYNVFQRKGMMPNDYPLDSPVGSAVEGAISPKAFGVAMQTVKPGSPWDQLNYAISSHTPVMVQTYGDFVIAAAKKHFPVATTRRPKAAVADVARPGAAKTSGQKRSALVLSVNVPVPGTRVEMPDLNGLKADEASRELGRRHLHFSWQKQESSLEDNGKVVDQQPEAGTKVPFDKPKAVTVVVGHYSDGLSYFSAKPVSAGQTVDLFFKKPKIEQFRRIQVQKTGYLLLDQISTPFPVKCNFFAPGSPDALGRGNRYFDGAQRVTPGQWVFSVFPEFNSDTSDQPVKVKVAFIPEFDFAEPNNSFEAATLLEPDAHIKIGFIGTDDHDFYRFEVKRPSYLLVRDDEADKPERTTRQNPQMDLYNAKGAELYSGPTDMARWLAPGVYFLNFYCERAGENFDTTPYGMDIRLLPDTEKIEPNDTPNQATPVKVPASLAVRYDTGGQNFYRLSSASPGYVIVSHPEKLPFAVKLWKTEADGAESRARWLPCAVRIDKTVTVRVDAEHREEYRVQPPIALNFLFIPGTEDPFEPNDTLAEAHPVAVDQEIQALSLPASDVDTYRFRLKKTDTVTLELTDKAEKCVLLARLYDRGGQSVGPDPIYLPKQLKLAAGEYLVQVIQENGLQGLHVSPYRFRVRTESGTPVEERSSERYKVEETSNESTRNGIELARRAYRHYRAGEYEPAVNLYHQAAELIPGVAAVWNDLGASEFHLDHLEASLKAFNKAMALKPDYALAWRNLGLLAGKQSDYAKSVQYSEKAARLDPSAENLRYAGHACLLAGAAQKDPAAKKQLWNQALAFFEKSLALEKNPGVQQRVKQLKQVLAEKNQGS